MARKVYTFHSDGRLTGQPTDTNTTDVAAVQAAVGVLVADGASPTQAHVNTLVTAWNAVTVNVNTTSAFKMVLDDSIYTTKNKVRGVIEAFLLRLQSDSAFPD